MKKLFGRSAGATAAAKKDGAGPLTNKTVQVGPHTVLVEHVLGLGGYGEIYRAVDISSGQRFALKHLRLDQENIAEVQREAKTMAKLRGHPNILRLHAVAFAGPKGAESDGFFLLDYCPGTLLDLMSRHKFMLETHTIIHIFGSVCHAVAAMHHQKPPLAHRDLKAENVLMLPDGAWVVCDFGSATTRAQLYDTPAEIAAEEDVIAKHTTPAYRPPEMWDLQLMRARVDTKVDIWALGVLLYVLCFGRLPFAGDSKLQIINARYDLPRTGHNRPQQLVALIQTLLQVDPTQRPTIDDLLLQLDDVARAVMGRSLVHPIAPAGLAAAASKPAAAAAAVSAGDGPPASRESQGSFSGLAASGRQQEAQQQHQQQQATLQAQQQQQFLREQQLQQYQQQQQQQMVQQQQGQQQRLQQLQKEATQQQQQRPQSGGGGGSFWSNVSSGTDSPTAAAAAPAQPPSAAASSGGASVSRLDHPPDWAHFSSPEQSPVSTSKQRQPAGGTSSNSGSSSAYPRGTSAGGSYGGSVGSAAAAGKRAPPPPPAELTPAPAAAAAAAVKHSASQGVRAHAVAVPPSPQDSPHRLSAADSPAQPDTTAAAVGGGGGGNPFAAERTSSGGAERTGSGSLHMRWQPPATASQQPTHPQRHQQLADHKGDEEDDDDEFPLQQEQHFGPGKLSQLLDIKARAAALSSARGAVSVRQHDTHSNGSVSSSPGSLGGPRATTTQQHHPFSGGGERVVERQPRPYSLSSVGSGGASSTSSRAQPWRGGQAAAAAVDSTVVGSPVSSVRSDHSLSQQQQQQLRRSWDHQQQQQQQEAPRHPEQPAFTRQHSAGEVGEGAGGGMAAVMAEVRLLRQQVQVLGEQNQAFVFRVKQLEEYTVQQQADMRRLQLQLNELQSQQQQQQQQQQSGGALAAAGSGQVDAGFSSDGGWLNPGRRTSPRVSAPDGIYH